MVPRTISTVVFDVRLSAGRFRWWWRSPRGGWAVYSTTSCGFPLVGCGGDGSTISRRPDGEEPAGVAAKRWASEAHSVRRPAADRPGSRLQAAARGLAGNDAMTPQRTEQLIHVLVAGKDSRGVHGGRNLQQQPPPGRHTPSKFTSTSASTKAGRCRRRANRTDQRQTVVPRNSCSRVPRLSVVDPVTIFRHAHRRRSTS